MTINELRRNLTKAVSPVFTSDFSRKYEMIARQDIPGAVDNISDTYVDDIDAYIRLAEFLDGNTVMLEALAKAANPLVVYGVFVRYHFLTQYFMAMEQSSQCDFASNDARLLSAVLIDKWKSHLSTYRRKD